MGFLLGVTEVFWVLLYTDGIFSDCLLYLPLYSESLLSPYVWFSPIRFLFIFYFLYDATLSTGSFVPSNFVFIPEMIFSFHLFFSWDLLALFHIFCCPIIPVFFEFSNIQFFIAYIGFLKLVNSFSYIWNTVLHFYLCCRHIFSDMSFPFVGMFSGSLFSGL